MQKEIDRINIRETTHKAFSLIELIVVVLIILIVGSIIFSTASKERKKQEILDPSTLPVALRNAFQGQGDIELFCLNKYKNCYVLQGNQINPYEGGIKFGKDVEIYKLDEDDHFVQIEEFGRYKDQEIVFRFHLYPNGSTTKMVINNDKGIYYLPSFFGKAQKVESMDEAKTLWLNNISSLHDSGSFY